MPRGLWDDLMRRADRFPRHCRSCGKRFYAKLATINRDRAIREADVKSHPGDFLETGF